MTRIQKIKSFFSGMVMILSAYLMIRFPEFGHVLVIAILSLSLTIRGIRYIIYYHTMARHMVDGQSILWNGVIFLEIGLYTTSLADVPNIYIMLYLVVVYLFDGVIGIMRALEAKQFGGMHWKLKLCGGIISIVAAVACLAFIRSSRLCVCIFCAGVVESAIFKIISAFRKTAIVYVK